MAPDDMHEAARPVITTHVARDGATLMGAVHSGNSRGVGAVPDGWVLIAMRSVRAVRALRRCTAAACTESACLSETPGNASAATTMAPSKQRQHHGSEQKQEAANSASSVPRPG